MKVKKPKQKKRPGISIRFHPDDQRLIKELQHVFGTTEVSSTLREAMIRSGELVGIRLSRVPEFPGYRFVA